LEILVASWNVRRAYHQARPSTEIEIRLPDKVGQEGAKSYQIAEGEEH
jgi:hypothetical protein